MKDSVFVQLKNLPSKTPKTRSLQMAYSSVITLIIIQKMSENRPRPVLRALGRACPVAFSAGPAPVACSAGFATHVKCLDSAPLLPIADLTSGFPHLVSRNRDSLSLTLQCRLPSPAGRKGNPERTQPTSCCTSAWFEPRFATQQGLGELQSVYAVTRGAVGHILGIKHCAPQ